MRNRNGFTPLEISQSVPVRSKSLTGFTLIELLVVITIIAVLAGLLIPGVMRAMQQAKANRALSEMQHLSTVLTQVYSEVGYYVRLEDLVSDNISTSAKRWIATDYINGQDDSTVITDLSNSMAPVIDVHLMWAGPYTTYKSYYSNALQNYTGSALPIPPNVYDFSSPINPQPTNLTNAPLDPWGRPYRMFWITGPAALVPVGQTHGAMVIISAGGDGILQSLIGIGQEQRPTRAQRADFDKFEPNNVAVTEKDVYYIFNAGIQ